MISSIEERDRAKQRLEQRSAEVLAKFILTLIHAPHGVGAYVEAFIATDEPERSVGIIEAQISALRRGETDYEWRHRHGDDFTARAELVLDAIEHVVLPSDAAGAVRLLERFYECEREMGVSEMTLGSRRYLSVRRHFFTRRPAGWRPPRSMPCGSGYCLATNLGCGGTCESYPGKWTFQSYVTP